MYVHDNDGRPPGISGPVVLPAGSAATAAVRRHPPFRAALGEPKTARKQAGTSVVAAQKKRWPCEPTPPSCRTSPVSKGEFGAALLHFTDSRCVHTSVPQLLTRSSTFMARVRTLDKQYLALEGPALCKLGSSGSSWWDEWAPNAQGVLSKGPFAGRRVLTVFYSATGPLFMPAGSIDNEYGYDIMVVRLPDGIGPDGKPHSGGSASSPLVIAQWISAIAHETTHAYNLVTSKSPAPATIPLRVRAAIKEEGDTRRTEARILAEIYRTSVGKRLRTVAVGMEGPADAWLVQRDFFPGDLRRTYLEHFVLNERMVDAIRRERLSASDVARINVEVDAIELHHRPLDKNLTDPLPIFYDPGPTREKGAAGSSGTRTISRTALFRTVDSDYGKFRFWLRVIDARWKKLLNGLASPPASTDAAREKMAQEHARAFFGGLMAYEAIPKKP